MNLINHPYAVAVEVAWKNENLGRANVAGPHRRGLLARLRHGGHPVRDERTHQPVRSDPASAGGRSDQVRPRHP